MSKESAYFALCRINGKHDLKELKRELNTFPGVNSVSVNPDTDRLAVDYDNTGVSAERLEKHLARLGYQVEDRKIERHQM